MIRPFSTCLIGFGLALALAANACGSDGPDDSSAGAGGASAGTGGGAGAGGASHAGTAGASDEAGADGLGVGGSNDTAAGAGGVSNDGMAGSSDGGAGDTDPTACNALTLQGALIPKTTNAGAAPVMMGGALPLGTYVLSKVNKYNGTQGSNERRETLVFSAGHHLEGVTEDDGEVTHLSALFTVEGTVLTINVSCPEAVAGTIALQYNSADGVLQTQSEPESSDQEIDVLTKQ